VLWARQTWDLVIIGAILAGFVALSMSGGLGPCASSLLAFAGVVALALRLSWADRLRATQRGWRSAVGSKFNWAFRLVLAMTALSAAAGWLARLLEGP
jgi:hypothetical protein